MTRQAIKDVLDEMTKEDLVAWIRSHHFSRPKRSDVLYLRWERQSAEVLEEMQKENRALDGVDFKERDRLAVRFNESKDPKEKLRLIKLIEPYDKAMSEHIKRSQAIDRKSKKVDALYEQIDVERQKENGRQSAYPIPTFCRHARHGTAHDHPVSIPRGGLRAHRRADQGRPDPQPEEEWRPPHD